MKRVILTALSISLMPVLGYGQLPPLDAAVGTWMMHHGAASLRGLQRLTGAITGPYVKCDNFFATAEGDPIVADINGDGSNEIVLAAVEYGRVYAFRGTDCSLLWSSQVLSSSWGSFSPAVGELDPTRLGLEIAVTVDATDRLYVLSGTNGSIIWSAPLGDVLENPPAIVDIDGDGIGEIFVSSAYTTYAFRGNGTLLWSYPAGYHSSNVAVGDLGNDGTLEVVFVGWDGSSFKVFALRATNGSFVWSYPLPSVGDVALGDLDNDGQLEVVVVYHGGGVIALRHNGTLYWSRSLSCNSCHWVGYSPNSPTIADLNGDGLREILVGCYNENTVYALRGTNGSTLWSYGGVTTCSQNSSHKIGDIDGDGALEVVLTSYHDGYAGSSCIPCPYHLIVLDGATGTVRWTWQNPVGIGFEGLAIADVDNDGCMEIVVGPNSATGGSRFYVLDSPTPVSDCGVLGYEDPVKVEEDRNIGGVYLLVSPVKGGVNVETGRRAFVEIYTPDGRKVKGLEVDRSAFVELKKGTYVFRVKEHSLYRTVIVR
ncbi:MAG: FG-GAP-like repeat-containing protein [Candidatus Caldipriscus sp.]